MTYNGQKICRIYGKWDKDLGCAAAYIIYADGTTEKTPLNKLQGWFYKTK